MLPVLGANAGTELVLAVVGVVQFPKSDFKAGWLAFCVVLTELVEVVPVGVLVMLEKMDGATVVLLMEPNTEDVIFDDSVEDGFVAEMVAEGNPAPAEVAPKMGLNVWTEGLISGVDIADEVAVGVTAKMGLNPEANRGLLLTEEELLFVKATAETGLEEEEVWVLVWPINPKSPGFPAVRLVLDATETWLGSTVKAEGSETPTEED